jgi:hypothetical protein
MRSYDTNNQLGLYAFLEGTDRHSGGNTWYVDSQSGNKANTSGGGQGESWSSPFSTINYAVSQCTNQGKDVILVAANHVETIQDTSPLNESGTVTDELCIDKSEVTIIGMGQGTARPTITLSGATDATVEIRAANVTFKNFIIVSGLADVAAGITVANAVDGTLIENVEFRDGGAANLELVLGVSISANSDDVTIRGCEFVNTAAGDNNAAIFSVGATIRLKIYDNHFNGDWDNAVIDLDASASTDTLIRDNIINQLDATVGLAIGLNASTTGEVIDNIIHCPSGTAAGPVVAAGALVSGNRSTINEGSETTPTHTPQGTGSVGNHWYVDSGTGTTTGDGKTWDTALSLIDDAIGKCVASNGDVIHVAAGHAEADLDGTAGQIFDVDVNGISIIGEGHGDARPTFTFTTDAANGTCVVTGTDVLLKNLIFKCNMASLEQMIDVAADDLTIEECEFLEGGQTPLFCIRADTVDNDSDNLVIKNCRFYLPTAGNQDGAIMLNKDHDGLRITGNYIMGNWDLAAIDLQVAANNCQDVVIANNTIISEQTGKPCIQVEQTALTVTGVCHNNLLVNDTRGACLQPNILNCNGNVWMPLGGNVKPVLLEGDVTTPGQNIYVNSAHAQAVDDTAHGGSWDFPLATIEYANTNCVTANNNDVIHVGPGHEETITDSVFLDFDSAGVTCLGYGNGDDKPMVTFDHANAVVDLGAASITIKNFLFRASVDGVAVGVDILAGFNHCRVIDCEFGDPEAGTDEFAIALQVNAACDYTEISGCAFHAGAQAGVTAVKLTGANAYLKMYDNWVTGTYSGPPILGSGAAITNCDIHNNILATAGGQDTFNLVAASTGFVRDNRIVVGAVTFAADLDIGNCWSMNNYMIADDDVGGAKCDHRYTVAASVTETADG